MLRHSYTELLDITSAMPTDDEWQAQCAAKLESPHVLGIAGINNGDFYFEIYNGNGAKFLESGCEFITRLLSENIFYHEDWVYDGAEGTRKAQIGEVLCDADMVREELETIYFSMYESDFRTICAKATPEQIASWPQWFADLLNGDSSALLEVAEVIFDDAVNVKGNSFKMPTKNVNANEISPNIPTKARLKEDLAYIKDVFSKRAITDIEKQNQTVARKLLGADCKWLSYILANEHKLGNMALTYEDACYFKNEVLEIANEPKPIVNMPFSVIKDVPVQTFLDAVELKCTTPKQAMPSSTAVQTPTDTSGKFQNIRNMIERHRPQPATQR